MEELWRGRLSERVCSGHARLDDESVPDEVVSCDMAMCTI
jgi:hypothetical protein